LKESPSPPASGYGRADFGKYGYFCVKVFVSVWFANKQKLLKFNNMTNSVFYITSQYIT
jgi:hypothetical protein